MTNKLVAFGDIFSIKKGVKVTQNENGENRYLSTEDLDNDNKIKYCIDNNNKYVMGNPNDILIAWDGSVGKFRHGIKGIIGSTIARLRINEEYSGSFSTKYIAYFLLTRKEYLIKTSTGATIKHINRKSLEKIRIPLLSMDVQVKIVNTLMQSQALIENRKAQIEKYDELLQSVFFDMFGDPVINPKGWDSQELKEVSDITSGVTKGKKNKEETFEVPYMRVANVQDGHINLDNIKMISVSKKDYEKFLLKKNDILLTEGGDPDKLGRGAVWYEEVKNCIHQNHIFRVRVDQGEINSEYLSRLIGSIYGKRYFLKIAKQTTGIATINKTQLSKFPVLLPPLELQNQFAEIVEKVEIEKKKIKDSLVELENNFNSIMQRAFRGELF